MRGSATGDCLFPSYSWERDQMNSNKKNINSSREDTSVYSLQSDISMNVRKTVLTVIREDALVYSLPSNPSMDKRTNLSIFGEDALKYSLQSNPTNVDDSYSQNVISRNDTISTKEEQKLEYATKRPSGAARRRMRKLKSAAFLEDALTNSYLSATSESFFPTNDTLLENLTVSVSNVPCNNPTGTDDSHRKNILQFDISGIDTISSMEEQKPVEGAAKKLSGAARRRLRKLKEGGASEDALTKSYQPASFVSSVAENKTVFQKLDAYDTSQNNPGVTTESHQNSPSNEGCQSSCNESYWFQRNEPNVWNWFHGKSPVISECFHVSDNNISNYNMSLTSSSDVNASCKYNFSDSNWSHQSNLSLEDSSRKSKTKETLYNNVNVNDGSCPNVPIVWDWSHQSNPTLFEWFLKNDTTTNVFHQNNATASELTSKHYLSATNESFQKNSTWVKAEQSNPNESISFQAENVPCLSEKNKSPRKVETESLSEPPEKITEKSLNEPIKSLNEKKNEIKVERNCQNVSSNSDKGFSSSVTPSMKKRNKKVVMPQTIYEYVVIATDDYPLTKITEELKDKILLSLMQEIDNVEPRIAPLRFNGYNLHVGALKIACMDYYSKEWLKCMVPKCKPWEGAKLQVIDPQLLLKRIRVSVWIPGPVKTSQQILTHIALQNKNVDTSGWKVVNEKQENGGQRLVIIMDETSWNTVMLHNALLYVNLHQVSLERLTK